MLALPSVELHLRDGRSDSSPTWKNSRLVKLNSDAKMFQALRDLRVEVAHERRCSTGGRSGWLLDL